MLCRAKKSGLIKGVMIMSGRKCECCHERKSGYCPFGNACKKEVWELFVERQRNVIQYMRRLNAR